MKEYKKLLKRIQSASKDFTNKIIKKMNRHFIFLHLQNRNNMTNTSKMTTRSSSKNIYSVTRSGIKYKPSIANNKKKRAIIIQPAVSEPIPFDTAYFVQLASSAIVEVVDLYRKNPNDVNLRFIQEAVSLTGRLHAAYLSTSPTNEPADK